jgi:putative redox protein
MTPIRVSSTSLNYQQQIEVDGFQFFADEPTEIGGDNTGPTPTDYVLAGLGSCKAITVKMYANRKGWDLQQVSVEIEQETIDRQPQIVVKLRLDGDLSAEQLERLRAIADKCPVHRLLTSEIKILTELVD